MQLLRKLWIRIHGRAVARALRVLGPIATLRLVVITAFGSARQNYQIRLPGISHPIWIRGGKHTDGIVIQELFVTDGYGFMGKLDVPKLMIDAGANVGIASIFFLNEYPSVRVIAIEPDPGNVAVLRKNLAPYGDRSEIIERALWSSAEPVALFSRTGIDEPWSVAVKSDRNGPVRGITLRDVINGRTVDLLKLDIEGAEAGVFSAAPNEWLPMIRNIVVELHGPKCERAFGDALRSSSYRELRNPISALPIVACLDISAKPDSGFVHL